MTVACGNAEEIVNWGHGGIVIRTIQRSDGRVEADPDDMARAIEDLIVNPGERRRLAQAGYQAWQQQFTWEKIAVRYEQLYQGLIEGLATSIKEEL